MVTYCRIKNPLRVPWRQATWVDQKDVKETLEKLHRGKRVLYDRGRARGLCLWPHTSVDLERLTRMRVGRSHTPQRVADLIKESLESRPIVARRHYIETGNSALF